MSTDRQVSEKMTDAIRAVHDLVSETGLLQAERNKADRSVASLTFERAELLRNRDAALSLLQEFDSASDPGRVRALVSDLQNTLRGRS